MRGGDGSGRWWEAEDGAMGWRRISATARQPAPAATHQRASQARQRRPGGASAPAGDAVARRGTSVRTGGAATAASGAAAAAFSRGDGALQARRQLVIGAAAATAWRAARRVWGLPPTLARAGL